MRWISPNLSIGGDIGSATDLIGVVAEAATDCDPGKWRTLREFRKRFTLADMLHRAIEADGQAADPDAITAACIDMSRAYIAGVGRHLPNAAITFDRFHVIQLANAALEELLRAEVRAEPAMKRSRWMWLKDKKKWTKKTDCTAPHAVTHAAEDRARLPLEGNAARNLRHGQHKGGGKGTDASLVPMGAPQ